MDEPVCLRGEGVKKKETSSELKLRNRIILLIARSAADSSHAGGE